VLASEHRIAQLEAELKSAPTGRRLTSDADWIPSDAPARILEGHRKQVMSVVFHPTFSVLATASDDCDVKVWDWTTGECEATLKGHTQSVKDVDFDGKGERIGELYTVAAHGPERHDRTGATPIARSASTSCADSMCGQHRARQIRRSSSGTATISGSASRRWRGTSTWCRQCASCPGVRSWCLRAATKRSGSGRCLLGECALHHGDDATARMRERRSDQRTPQVLHSYAPDWRLDQVHLLVRGWQNSAHRRRRSRVCTWLHLLTVH